MENTSKIEVKNITEVFNHPINDQIYTDSSSVEDLKESIRMHGQLTPITINSNGETISGNRRLKAMIELGLKEVSVIVKDYPTKEDEVMAVIAFNNQRRKTVFEMQNEITFYRQMLGNRQGQRTDLLSDNADALSTRKQISIALGISEGNVQKLEFIGKNAQHLIPFINSGEYSIHGAYQEASKLVKAATPKSKSPETQIKAENKETLKTAPKSDLTKEVAITDENFIGHQIHTCINCGHQTIIQK
jgi:ParB/RepB/Spo0J family partition protein